MPARITKEVALERLAKEPRTHECLMCSILASPELMVLERSPLATTHLTRYPLHWGHAMVSLHEHVNEYGALSEEGFADAMRLVHRIARRIEEKLTPLRVFVASLGSPRNDLTMTSPHLHWHVIPVMGTSARPADVLTWENGVWEGSPSEWQDLRRTLNAD